MFTSNIKLFIIVLLFTVVYSYEFQQAGYDVLLNKFDNLTQRVLRKYCPSFEAVDQNNNDKEVAPYTTYRFRCRLVVDFSLILKLIRLTKT